MIYASDRVPAVDRALDLLEVLSRSNRALNLTELSRKLRIPYSSAYYITTTLTTRGYLQRIPGTRRYSLGVRAFDFTPKAIWELRLRELLAPHTLALARRSLLPVTTGILVGDEGLIIDRAVPPCGFNDVWIGRHFELHCTATGKTLVAWLPDAELNKLFADHTFFKFSPKTISSLEILEAHLGEVRKNGFAVNDEESAIGIRAIAAPIFGHLGSVIAGVSVGGMTEKPLWRIRGFISDLLQIAKEVSRQIPGN